MILIKEDGTLGLISPKFISNTLNAQLCKKAVANGLTQAACLREGCM